MKVIAIYLPQFHRVKENDEWWGEGFTEWTAVKNAEVLFDGQIQPRRPLNRNYYDLLEKKTMQWQADLMHRYQVYGMAFYHYWFKDGRQILEKPAENLLRWTDIEMPFCFSWANETWARSWSKLSEKNTWSSKIDTTLSQERSNNNGVLLEQSYGNETDWTKHFYYLLNFFKDKRYIKVEGKPVFIIYKPLSIVCLTKMVMCWRKLAQKEHLPGLYFIGVNYQQMGVLDAVLLQEPQNSIRSFKNTPIVDADKLWKQVLANTCVNNQKTYYCAFPGYDDTPRRGEGGHAVSIVNPEHFQKYLEQLMKKSELCGNEFVFINAWNEWAEGMYLEPDEQFGYGYLEAVSNASENYKNTCVEFKDNGYREDSILIDRYRSYWQIMDKWICLLEEEKTIAQYFEKRNIETIALYGVGMMGRHLIKQLEHSHIKIAYGIDIRGNDEQQQFPIFNKYPEGYDVDAIIITVTYETYPIYTTLEKEANCSIILLEEIIGELLE